MHAVISGHQADDSGITPIRANANGAITVGTMGAGTCTYDANGNLSTEAITINGTTKTRTYTYDANGNVLSWTDWT